MNRDLSVGYHHPPSLQLALKVAMAERSQRSKQALIIDSCSLIVNAEVHLSTSFLPDIPLEVVAHALWLTPLKTTLRGLCATDNDTHAHERL